MKKTVQDVLDIMVEAGAITGEKAAEAASLASYTNDLDAAVEKADFVQECVPERIELKQSIYRSDTGKARRQGGYMQFIICNYAVRTSEGYAVSEKDFGRTSL